MTRLLAGDVEADDATVAVRDRQLRHLERVGPIAHRADDLAEADLMIALGSREAALDRDDDLLEVQAPFGVEHRRVAHLRVHDAVAREVLAAFVCDTLDRLRGLHDRDRVREATEVERERSRSRAHVEPASELVGVFGRQALVAQLARKLDHGGGPQPAVEVVVEKNLWRGAQRRERDHRAKATGRSSARRAYPPRGSPPRARGAGARPPVRRAGRPDRAPRWSHRGTARRR